VVRRSWKENTKRPIKNKNPAESMPKVSDEKNFKIVACLKERNFKKKKTVMQEG
jgi:hypothetical protein